MAAFVVSRLLIAGSLVLGLVAACGGGDDDSGAGGAAGAGKGGSGGGAGKANGSGGASAAAGKAGASSAGKGAGGSGAGGGSAGSAAHAGRGGTGAEGGAAGEGGSGGTSAAGQAPGGGAGQAGAGGEAGSAGASGVEACTASFAIESAAVTATLMDDGMKPMAADFSGGTIESGTYDLTAVVHHGSHYGDSTLQTLVIDASAHTLVIGDGDTSGSETTGYFGYDLSNPDSVTLEGQMNCCSSELSTLFCTPLTALRGWYYTFSGTGSGATLTWSSVGSEDLQTYTKR